MKYILSLDGGGIRGKATATFLAELEKALDKPLTDQFDLIAGTSTGGIIAGGLAVTGLTAQEAADLYNYENANIIFPQHDPKGVKGAVDKALQLKKKPEGWEEKLQDDHPELMKAFETGEKDLAELPGEATGWWDWIKDHLSSLIHPRYDGVGKEKILHEKLGTTPISKSKTGVMISSFNLSGSQLGFFSDYAGMSTNIGIDVATNCTSAAPTYFPAVRFNRDWMVDGGVGVNNPSMAALVQAWKRFPGEEVTLLSVGTGTSPSHSIINMGWGPAQWLVFYNLINVMMEAPLTLVDEQVKSILESRFLRVNSVLPKKSMEEMDNVSQENIDDLEALGKTWWDDFGNQTVKLLK